MKTWAALFAGLAVLSLGAAYAADLDNNGIVDDEIIPDPGSFTGMPDRDEVVVFPTSQDTWQIYYYPYWWHVGDTVFGTHTVALGSVSHADVTLYLTTNSLTMGCGFVNVDFRIAGTTVGTVAITPEGGLGPFTGSFDFAPQTPPFELRYYETNQVAGGCGSVVFDESGRSQVSFGGSTPVTPTTWGELKDLYR